jgi:heme O synthase-like polyprenyltransferase
MRAGLAGGIYGASALALGALFLPLALRLYITRYPQDGQRVFLASLAYLPLLFGVMIFDRNLGAL